MYVYFHVYREYNNHFPLQFLSEMVLFSGWLTDPIKYHKLLSLLNATVIILQANSQSLEKEVRRDRGKDKLVHTSSHSLSSCSTY